MSEINQALQALRPSQVIQRTSYSVEYDLYLHGEIDNPDDMMEHYNVYRQATENDLIRLWIISPGGSSATAAQYFQHMVECEAIIVGIPGCENASAATAVAMHCDELQIGPFTTFMIHGVSYGYYGTAKRMATQSEASSKFNDKFMNLVYKDFLTPEEIKFCLDGNDILLDSEQIQERWDRTKEARNQEVGDDADYVEPKTLEQVIKDLLEEVLEAKFPTQKAAKALPAKKAPAKPKKLVE